MTRGLRETIRLLVCEPEPRWFPALKALLAQHPDQSATLRPSAVPSYPVPSDPTDRGGPTLILAEGEPVNFNQFLSWTAAARRADNVEVVALLGRGFDRLPAERLAMAEDALREAGAIAVLRSTTELPRAVRLAKRHAEQTAIRQDAISLPRESIWRRLPWQPPAGPLR